MRNDKEYFQIYTRGNTWYVSYDIYLVEYNYITYKYVTTYLGTCEGDGILQEVREMAIPKSELNNYIKELKKNRRLEEMDEFTKKCYTFLDGYQDKKISKIVKKYDRLLKNVVEKTDKYKAEKLLQEIAKDRINANLEQFEPLLPSNFDRDDLRIECTPRIVDISGEEVCFELSKNDKETLNELSSDKESEVNQVKDIVEEVKMMVLTCENDERFNKVLAAYNIIDENTGKAII